MEYVKLANGVEMPRLGLGTDDIKYLWNVPASKNRYINKCLKYYKKYYWTNARENEYVDILCFAFSQDRKSVV